MAGACADQKVYLLDAPSGQASSFAAHDKAVRAVRFVQMPAAASPLLATGSWDKTVRYWDLRASTTRPLATVASRGRVYAMDAAESLLVVGTAERHIHTLDLAKPTVMQRTMESPLKEQTRAVAAYRGGDGFAIGSIEGRCGFHMLNSPAVYVLATFLSAYLPTYLPSSAMPLQPSTC